MPDVRSVRSVLCVAAGMCALAAAAPSTASATLPAAWPAPDTTRTPLPPFHVETPRYELYAPSEEALRVSREELDFAAAAFERRFGAEPPRLAVVVFGSPTEIAGFDRAQFGSRGLRFLPWVAESSVGMEGPRALSHEACHAFLIARIDSTVGRAPAPADGARRVVYGHASLPDWYDEATATLCEYPALRAGRLQRLRAGTPVIPLAELFSMEHPLMGWLRASVGTGTPQAGVTQVRVTGSAAGVDPARSLAFYGEALSLGEFIGEREGAEFWAGLGAGLARGATMEQLLAGARNLPHDVAGLEREWQAWVAANPAGQ